MTTTTLDTVVRGYADAAKDQITATEAGRTAELTAQESARITYRAITDGVSANAIMKANVALLGEHDDYAATKVVPTTVPDVCQYGRIGRILDTLEGSLDLPLIVLKRFMDTKGLTAARLDRIVKHAVDVDDAVSEVRKAAAQVRKAAKDAKAAELAAKAAESMDPAKVLADAFAMVESAIGLEWSDETLKIALSIMNMIDDRNAEVEALALAAQQDAAAQVVTRAAEVAEQLSPVAA